MTNRRNKDKEIEELKARNTYLENKNKIFTSWKNMSNKERLFLVLLWVVVVILIAFIVTLSVTNTTKNPMETKEDYEKILDHCRKGLPNESCGLLGGTIEGDVKTIEKVYLLTNIDESNEHFSMDPKEQLSAIKDIRQNGYQMIGNFHSHPESPSRPSEEDKRLAFDPNIEYLILSLMDAENPVLKAFGVDKEKNVTVHEIQITE